MQAEPPGCCPTNIDNTCPGVTANVPVYYSSKSSRIDSAICPPCAPFAVIVKDVTPEGTVHVTIEPVYENVCEAALFPSASA